MTKLSGWLWQQIEKGTILINIRFGLQNTKECSMTYRQSEMYNHAKYLKNLPLQSVSSRGNLQAVDKFRKCASFFYAQGGNVGVWVVE